LGTYSTIVGAWALACAPFFVMDYFCLGETWRIQRTDKGDRVRAATDPKLKSAAARMVIFNWAWLLPVVMLAAPTIKQLFPADMPAPRYWQAPILAYLWFICHDIGFYSYHRLLHEVPKLYVNIHKQHHLFTAPWAWSSTAVHPVEMLLQSIGGVIGPLIHSLLFGLPIHAVWLWLALIMVQGVFDHSGFALPIPLDLFGMIPGFGGTAAHDDHHKYFTCNYAAAFHVIDDIMGTSRQSGYLEKRAAKSKSS
jgi:methylsterol monooxygenase